MIHDNLFITQCPYCFGDGWDVDNGEPEPCPWCDSGKARKLEAIHEFLRNAPVSPEAVPDIIMKILVGGKQ